jgi:type IV pilus assembly protein PilQ
MKILEPHLSKEALVTESPTFNAIVVRDRLTNINAYAKVLERFLKEKPSARKPVTKIFYLKYITPKEFMKMIEPLRSEAGFILSGEEHIVGTSRVERIGGAKGEAMMPIGARREEIATGQEYITKIGGAAGEATIYERRKSLSTILSDFNAVMITDYPEVIERIKERFSQYISDVPIQVKIEAKILEVRKDILQEIGLSWNLATSPAKVPTFWKAGAGTNVDVFTTQTPGLSQIAGSILTFTLQKGSLNALNLKLSAYEKVGKIKSIAKPTVITVNVREAIIRQGQEIPYVTTQLAGNTVFQTVYFKDAVLELKVIPLISPDDRIMLDIVLTYDTPGEQTPQGPAINTKEVRTRVVVNHGDTIVIGGILEQQENKTNEGMPKLVRVPILKWLFGQEQLKSYDNELLIFLTPMILKE